MTGDKVDTGHSLRPTAPTHAGKCSPQGHAPGGTVGARQNSPKHPQKIRPEGKRSLKSLMVTPWITSVKVPKGRGPQ